MQQAKSIVEQIEGQRAEGTQWQASVPFADHNTICSFALTQAETLNGHHSIVLLQDAGFTHIWLPPPSQSVADQGYLPGQLYNLDSKYGNKEQLQELCKELKAAGIVPLADIVINHRCADEKGEDGVYNTFRSVDS